MTDGPLIVQSDRTLLLAGTWSHRPESLGVRGRGSSTPADAWQCPGRLTRAAHPPIGQLADAESAGAATAHRSAPPAGGQREPGYFRSKETTERVMVGDFSPMVKERAPSGA